MLWQDSKAAPRWCPVEDVLAATTGSGQTLHAPDVRERQVVPAKTKRGLEEGDRTENVINCRKLSCVTFYDEFYDEFYDILCQWNKETEIVIKCRKMS